MLSPGSRVPAGVEVGKKGVRGERRREKTPKQGGCFCLLIYLLV
jgi:hypothetical protein